MEDWIEQLKNSVNSLDQLTGFIQVTEPEKRAIETLQSRWGTTPYFASLMDREDPSCPIRRQVIPSLREAENSSGWSNYLIVKENRANGKTRPDSIARQYYDRVAFTVTDRCASYCRHCFRKELVVNRELSLRLDVGEGLRWIKDHAEVRDVLVTGGDPFILTDDRIEYLIRKLREIPHIEMLRFGTRTPIVLPHRITPGLMRVLDGFHRVPIWLNTQCNHAAELTELTAGAVYNLLRCGVNVGNQAVLLKGINDNVEAFKMLHQRLLTMRIRPYYLFHCEPAPGVGHFRTSVERGAELIRDALRGHTTGLAQPMYVVDTYHGKIPVALNGDILAKDEVNERAISDYLRTT
jgi:lysine 2,3-aminomutase